MTFDELEELISEVLTSNFTITTDKRGQVIIQTGLIQDEDGELSDMDDDDDDDDDLEYGDDDEDFESYEELDEDDE